MTNRLILVVISTLFLFIVSAQNTFAIYDPLSVPNNKFGIHIVNDSDLMNAANLVNSSGGDWGYVAIVISESERNKERWQKTFDDMRRFRLIPIVRLATKSQNGGVWEKPKLEEINNWIAFLNSLNWVTKNRYIVIGNEPNHAKEWGGVINPEEYATYLKEFSKKLKQASGDFFVLPAGLDASAPNGSVTMDEEMFITKMKSKEADIFEHIDGWTSHSYPNPDFSGKETDTGRGTVKGYDWELDLLQKMGVSKKLPVFITETGWKIDSQKGQNDDEHISQKLTYAFSKVWTDEKIVAVTPFVLSYTQKPFMEFSWQKQDGTFYSFYEAVSKIEKTRGMPIQEEIGILLAVFINPVQRLGTTFQGTALVKNVGQSIWDFPRITLYDEEGTVSVVESFSLGPIEPLNYGIIRFKAINPARSGLHFVKFVLHGGQKDISNTFPFELVVLGETNMQSSSIFDKLYALFRK